MSGSVTSIIGPMYAGKSTALQSYLRRAGLAMKRVMMFKPAIDNRYAEDAVVTHDGKSYPALSIQTSQEAWDLILDELPDVVGFDEAQFFDEGLISLIDAISLGPHNIDVFVAGLDTDFKGNPFPVMMPIVFRSDDIVKLTAVCFGCGADAIRTQRMVDGKPVTDGEIVSVGGVEAYEARCRHCFVAHQ